MEIILYLILIFRFCNEVYLTISCFSKIKRININKLNLRYKNLEVRFKNVLVKCGKKNYDF